MKKTKTVDSYLESKGTWREALDRLRAIALGLGLQETIKWGLPVYTHQGANIVGLGAFDSYVGLWFFQGALLRDAAGKLVNAQRGKTRAMRQWRFQSAAEIDPGLVEAYMREAMGNQEAGKTVKPKTGRPVVEPDELKQALDNGGPRAEFDALSLGKRRDYAEYIAEAKRPQTKARRLAKILPLIRGGHGLNDQYRS